MNETDQSANVVRMLPPLEQFNQPPFDVFAMSPTVGKLAEALAKAQGEFTTITREKTAEIETKSGATYSYKYADLADVLEACQPYLSKQGIAIVQSPYDGDSGAIGIVTTLMHSSGEWIMGRLAHSIDMKKWQDMGAALTFLRRYTASAMTGVASEDDNDAGDITTPRRRRKPANPEPRPEPTGAEKAEGIAKAIKTAQTPEAVDKTLEIFTSDLQWLHDHMRPYWDRLQQRAQERRDELADLAANPPFPDDK